MDSDSVLNIRSKAEDARLRNILDMAISFAAMRRVFEEGSTTRIHEALYQRMPQFLTMSTEQDYHKLHTGFCQWFTLNIKMARSSRPASWGQAAKALDVVLKVCIYYCRLPSHEYSSRVVPWLNGAVDTAILHDLRTRFRSSGLLYVNTLADIGRNTYEELQRLVRKDIKQRYHGCIFPVQYDDIRWRELNK